MRILAVILKSLALGACIWILLIASVYLYGFFDNPPLKGNFVAVLIPLLFSFSVGAFFIVRSDQVSLKWKTQVKIVIAFIILWLLTPLFYSIFGMFAGFPYYFAHIFYYGGFFLLNAYYISFLYLLPSIAISIFVSYVAYFISYNKMIALGIVLSIIFAGSGYYIFKSNNSCVRSDYWCVANKAVENKNPQFCATFRKLWFEQSKEINCYNNYATKTGDAIACEMIAERGKMYLSKYPERSELIMEINKEDQGRCYTKIALTNSNPDICESALSMKSECYFSFAEKKNEPSFCQKIDYLPYRKECCSVSNNVPRRNFDTLNAEERFECGIYE